MAKKTEENVTAPAATEPELVTSAAGGVHVATFAKQWDTTLKLGAIEEANYATLGAVVVGIDRATGELTLRSPSEHQPHGRSREVAE